MPTSEPISDIPDTRESAPPPPERQKPGHSTRHWLLFAFLVIVAAIGVIFLGWLPRHKRNQQIDNDARRQAQSVPHVQVVRIEQPPPTSELMIPGTTLAYTEAYIYARASGYVTRRLVDIGDRVHEGQLLATIDAPELDKQVSQARSTLQQSESNLAQMEAQLHLASLTWDRYKVLVGKGVFSRQEGDTQEANYRVADANVRAAENTVQANRDNVERLIVLQQYERVTAPFSGMITARNIDVGTLISSGGSGLGTTSSTAPGTTQSAAQGNNQGPSGNLSSSTTPTTGGSQGGEMFAIANIDRLRILISIPEAYTSLVRVAQKAELFFQELPNEKLEGRVTRTSASIDQSTRTLLVEVQAPNRGGRILPGMYVVVNLIEAKEKPPILVPGESIVVRGGQTVVAEVQDGVVHFRRVSIGRDYGDQTEIVSGLKPGDVVAINVSDEVLENAKVEPRFANNQTPSATNSTQQPATEGQYGDQFLMNQTQSGAKGKGGAKGGKSGGSGGQGGKQGASGSAKK